MLGLLLLPALLLAGAPPAPAVNGPRQTASQEPIYVFRSAGAARYACAFDSTRLHPCSASYSQWLTVGAHVLRVQAVSKSGARSRAVSVGVRVRSATGLYTDARVRVGNGAGVPAVLGSSVWVPATLSGTVARVDVARKAVTATTKLGSPPRFTGYLDSAIAAGNSVWVARDVGGEIDRIDPASGKLVSRIKVDTRPGGLAQGGGYVWAFHFTGESVSRIDASTGTRTAFTVKGALGTGIAYADGAVWLLTEKPSFLYKLDAQTGAQLAKVAVDPSGPAKHGIVDTWTMTVGAGSLWVVNANFDKVTRVDAATAKVVTTIALPIQVPFGAEFFRGAVWVSGAGKVVRIDPATNRITGTVTLSTRSIPIFTEVAGGDSGLWATDYDAGVLYRVHVP